MDNFYHRSYFIWWWCTSLDSVYMVVVYAYTWQALRYLYMLRLFNVLIKLLPCLIALYGALS